MTRFEIVPWVGRFQDKGVIKVLRRKIAGRAKQECVLIDLEGVYGIGPLELANLISGWPENRVRCCGVTETLPFPLPQDVRPCYATRRVE